MLRSSEHHPGAGHTLCQGWHASCIWRRRKSGFGLCTILREICANPRPPLDFPTPGHACRLFYVPIVFIKGQAHTLPLAAPPWVNGEHNSRLARTDWRGCMHDRFRKNTDRTTSPFICRTLLFVARQFFCSVAFSLISNTNSLLFLPSCSPLAVLRCFVHSPNHICPHTRI
ncbi:hypothetical protein DL89DRAFT_67039 [Linderina pennispora]|uniref:Uncharacterized protein n=1 Tax=Linderina pennispora TaxID=61395 RepID=A0A1Y1VR84_9FUNG|nr:uncharacterized protein DL89DRAFT_67039 [Linderina pennispora]ORX63789.1 hypothetical protein DL89DRAFT_67039 [Linderina pennispora]